MNDNSITLYNLTTRSFTTIPESELAPGMVKAQIEGREGSYWIDPSQVRMSEYRHPPFIGEVSDIIHTFVNAFPGIYDRTYEFWEDGFRRDTHPEREIAIWMHIADVYQRHTKNRGAEYCTEVFSLIMACSTSDPKRIRYVSKRLLISKANFRRIVADYYSS